MNTTMKRTKTSSGGWLIILLGLWILVSPFVLGYDGETAGMLSDVISGAALVLIGIVSEWVNGNLIAMSVPVAAWVFISAFVLNLWGLSLLWSNVIMTFSVMIGAGIVEGVHLPRFAENSGSEMEPRPKS